MSTLLERQFLFTRCLVKLFDFIHVSGAEFTLGEGYIGDSVQAGEGAHMPNSLHFKRLAQDINLFIDGKYIAGVHPMWYRVGEYWKSLDPACRWGGDFKIGDFNHFSVEFGGVA